MSIAKRELFSYQFRDDFVNMLKDHKEDYETYCYLRDKLLFYGDLEVIGAKC